MYTELDVEKIYQVAYHHGLSKEPPLTNEQVLELLELIRDKQ